MFTVMKNWNHLGLTCWDLLLCVCFSFLFWDAKFLQLAYCRQRYVIHYFIVFQQRISTKEFLIFLHTAFVLILCIKSIELFLKRSLRRHHIIKLSWSSFEWGSALGYCKLRLKSAKFVLVLSVPICREFSLLSVLIL